MNLIHGRKLTWFEIYSFCFVGILLKKNCKKLFQNQHSTKYKEENSCIIRLNGMEFQN